jgi:hypothetical protein
MTHDCPGPECHPYPTFDDDPARWGLRLPEPVTEAGAQAAELAEVWGSAGPPASYAEWLAEGLEPEAEPLNLDLPVPYWPACPPIPDAAAAPIPYRLTPLAEAVLDDAASSPEPEAGL